MPQPDPPAAPSVKRRGALARALDWFWCGSAFRALRDARQLPSARTLELSRRAHAALELARVAQEPTRAVEHGPHHALACDLCAQSVYWSLLARESLATPSEPRERETLQSLWERTAPAELARAAGDAESATRIRDGIVARSFVDHAAAPVDEQARLARELRPFAEALLQSVDGAERALERLWFRRLVRLSLPVVLLALVLAGVFYGVERIEQARDVARGRPWTASSRWPEGGCLSPAQECPGSPSFFFSTNEEDSPWVEFDLGSVQDVSGFSISNRKDCCQDRAIPLVVEVSTDHAKWREVARRSESFTTWKASFSTTKARWVRFRVARRSFLHLSSVRVFR